MKRYEILVLTTPEITADESSWLEMQLSKLIQKDNGTFVSFDRWGKYKLAYSIRKNDYGVYFLIRFEVEDASCDVLMAELKEFFRVKAQEIVMRELVSRLDINKSLDYQKPPSLEDAPAQEVDTFLREKGVFNKRGRGRRNDFREDISEEVSGAEEPVALEKEPVVPEKEAEEEAPRRHKEAEQNDDLEKDEVPSDDTEDDESFDQDVDQAEDYEENE